MSNYQFQLSSDENTQVTAAIQTLQTVLLPKLKGLES